MKFESWRQKDAPEIVETTADPGVSSPEFILIVLQQRMGLGGQ